MKQIDWNQILKEVETQVLALAQDILKEYEKQATEDVKTFMETSKESLLRWGKLAAAGDIDKEEFQSLVKGQLDVAELHALKQAGLAQVRFDTFVRGVVLIVTSVVASAAKALI